MAGNLEKKGCCFETLATDVGTEITNQLRDIREDGDIEWIGGVEPGWAREDKPQETFREPEGEIQCDGGSHGNTAEDEGVGVQMIQEGKEIIGECAEVYFCAITQWMSLAVTAKVERSQGDSGWRIKEAERLIE